MLIPVVMVLVVCSPWYLLKSVISRPGVCQVHAALLPVTMVTALVPVKPVVVDRAGMMVLSVPV